MTNELNFKELYSVALKATYPIEVGGKVIEPGEIVALFDKIQIANFQEIKSIASAKGGYDNRTQIIWESTREVKVSLTQGVFSKTQLALMTNAQLLEQKDEETISLTAREEHESDEGAKIVLKHEPRDTVFIYDKETGVKITGWERNGKEITLNRQYQAVIVDYEYDYTNGGTKLCVGRPLTTGYLSLTGKTRVKDDITGKVVTGIIKIPKLRLMSDLSMRMGSDAIPQLGRIDAIAVPEGVRGQTKVMEIIFLNDDVDADM